MRALLLVLGLAACAEPGAALSFEAEVRPVLAACVGCHAGTAPDGGLDLSGDLYDALLTVDSEQAYLPLVEPFDSRASYVWHKIGGTQGLAGGSGTRMPLGAPLSPDDVDLVALWIDLGAAP